MSAFEKFQRFLITVLIAVAFFYGGYYFGKRGYLFEIRKNPPKIEVVNRYPANKKVNFDLFWEVWDIVSAKYLERPVDPQKMLYGAISGMVSSLGDPYTSFLPPEINKVISDSLNGKYEGIGAELGVRDGNLIIVSPLDGSPAKEMGLKAGDKIVEIEGKTTFGMTLSEAVAKIRGEAGTTSTLKVQTGNDKPRDVKIRRRVINVPSVTWEDKGDGTVYIRVSRFDADTNDEWSRVASEVNIKMTELDAIVIDVRGNPGGYLQSAVYVAEEFFHGKPVLYEESATGEQKPYMAERVGTFENVPGIFVLVDGGSASASEILASALKVQRGATLIGERTFGKGTIQEEEKFKDGSGAHITVSKWLTAAKEWIHKTDDKEGGIQPDIVVTRTDEEMGKNVDSQLNRAIELAKEL